jgi:hypothetical protein
VPEGKIVPPDKSLLMNRMVINRLKQDAFDIIESNIIYLENICIGISYLCFPDLILQIYTPVDNCLLFNTRFFPDNPLHWCTNFPFIP